MKNLKRVLSGLLTLVLLAALLPQATLPVRAANSGTCGENLTWSFNTNTGLLTIQGSGAMENYLESAFVPWHSISKSVTAVSLPDGLTSIGDSAFYGCSGLNSVTIPASVNYIGDSAFRKCSGLTSVTIPNGVTSILSYTFRECFSLCSVAIPASVTSIDPSAFDGCSAFNTFSVASENQNYSSDENGVLFNKDKSILILYPRGKDGAYTVPAGVTAIGNRAFSGCSELTSVTISEGVVSIDYNAFSSCTGLTSVTISGSVTSIGNYVFSGCTGLTSLIIPKSVTSIGDYVFSGCTGLTSLSIPESVTSIGEGMLCNCSGLTSVTLPENMTAINNHFFNGCTSLTSLTFPEGVTAIGYYAFSGCSGLTSLTLPESLTAIGNYAFYECSGLTSVTIPEGVNEISEGTFSRCTSLSSVTIPKSVKNIYTLAFYYCPALSSVKLSNGLVSIDADAFYNCPSLKAITIPSSVTQIGNKAFGYPKTGDFEIYGLANSAAQTYANQNGFRFVALSVCEANGHDYSLEIRPEPTVVSDGHLTASCKNCDEVVSVALPKLSDADYSYNVINPVGCITKGRFRYTWKNKTYGAVYFDFTVIPLGHDFLDGVCARCGVRQVEQDAPLPFTDVKESAYYYDAVKWAVYNEIATGTSATTFGTKSTCTRAQVMTFLWKAAGSPEPVTTENPFTDVKETAYYYKAVLWAVEKGITTGTSETTFGPKNTCTRSQVMTFLWIYSGSPEPKTVMNPFMDVKPSSFYYKAVLWAVENGITTGTAAETFSPKSTCTRAQVVTFLWKALT